MQPDPRMFLVFALLAAVSLLWRGDLLPALVAGFEAWLKPEPEAKKPWADWICHKGGDAPKPDPAIGRAAMKQAELGEQWLSFSKDMFATSQERQKGIDEITTKVANQQLDTVTQQAEWAKADRERYDKIFKPLQDEYIAEATNYASPEKQAEAAATAKADVQTQAAAERGATGRRQAALGINPASGRATGIDRAAELGTALASAGAQNSARTMVRDKGLALKADAINLGNGLPAQAGQSVALGLNAGNAATGNVNNANGQFLGSTGIVGQGFQGAQQGYAGQASTLNDLYKGQLAQWNAQNSADSAMFDGIGSLVGMGLSMMPIPSSKKLKTNKEKLKDGAAVEALNAMPVEKWKYKEGAGDGGEHIGPYAEDMQKATGLGDGKSIALQDAIGITMKAVQDLSSDVGSMKKAIGLGTANKSRSQTGNSSMKKAA